MQHEQALLGPAARREALRKRLHQKEQQAKARLSAASQPPPGRAPHAHDDGELQRDSDDNDRALETNEDNIDGPAVEPGDVAAELNARIIEGARESVQRALERERRDEEYHEEKALRVERNAELSRLAIESEGVEFVKGIHEGRVLFHGTGIPGKDALHNQVENADAEVDLLVDSHQEWTLRSPELQEGLEALTPRTRQLRRDRDSELGATILVAQGRIEKKRNFLLRVQRADREANEAHDEAEKVAAEAQELLEKLRKQHNVLSFEARAKTRRVMLAKQAEASVLRKTADAAKEDAKQLKRHMIERGLAPDSFVSTATNVQSSPHLAKTKLPALGADLRAPHTEASHLTERDASQADDPDPPSTPDPQDWDYHLREGLKMSHLELMDSSTRRQHRMADAEAALSRQQEQELAQIKNRVRLARKAQHEARKSASTAGRPPSQSSEMSISTAASSESLLSEKGNINEKEGSSKRSDAADNRDDNDDERLDATDFVAAAMSAANVSHQNRKVLVSQADLDASTVRGMTLETAPPFCNEWGFKQRCTRAQCQGRHFYVSPEEAQEWQMRRAAVDASLEMGVLDAIASREQLIASARSEAEACSRRFQSHLSGFVQTEDVGSLLYLLNRLRAASVRVVEALVKWRRGGETRLSAAEGAAETFAESFLKPRGWVVKIGFMGEQLYPGSKAFSSKVKRFSRDEDVNGKRALRFRYVGIYETREQALRAYEDEIKRLMAKEMCGPENFPKPKTIIRACGKHFAVESEMGVPNTRCEICFANSFNHFGKYSPSYMWNGQNYLLKMLHDTNFLEDIELLRLFFKEEFEAGKLSFRGNPFLLAADIQNGERRELRVRKVRSETALAGDTTTKQAAANFGVPTDAVVVHPNQCIEWHGHMSRGPQIAVGKQRAYISLHVTSRHLVDEFARKYEAKHFEVVDMRRIRAAQAVLREEKDLARYMYESRLDAKAKATQLLLAAEKQARREERARRRENGEEVESSSENDSSEESSSGEDNTQSPVKGPAAVGKKDGSSRKKRPIVFRTYKTPDVLSKEEVADLSNGTARRRRAPRYNPQTQAERLSESRLHTAYFWERGEYIAVQQVRHELWGKKPGVWATGDPGTTFEGMQVRGEHRKHFDFNRKLKEQGKTLVARRKRIQHRLAKSLRRGDACNPETIIQLVQLGREAQGSLLLMDCDTAELFLQKWQQRTRAAGIIQRNLRAAFARAFCTDLRVRIAANAELELRRGRNAVKLARRFTRKVVRKSVHRAKQRMKRPFLTEAVEYEGETVLVSIHDAHKLGRFTRSKATLLEPCFACRGLTTRTRERRDLAWLSVRGEPCVPGNVESCDRGIVKLERIFHAGAGNGPCYCRRAHASHSRLLFEAYFPATSQTICGVFRFAFLLRGLRRVDAGIVQQARRAARKAADILLRRGASAARLLPNLGERTVVPSTYACRKKRELRLRLVHLVDLLQEFDRRDRHCHRLWKGTQGLYRGVKRRARVAQENLKWREKAHVQASEHLHNAHATMLAAQVHKHAMVQACDTALNFSKRQIELYEDLSLSTNQQAWDPLENANNAIYIQRKWQATKAVDLAIHIRNLAIHRAFEASIEYATSKDHAVQTASLLRSTQCEIMPTIELIQKDTRAVRDLLHASLRAIVQTSIRKLVAIKRGRQSRAGPLVQRWCLLERQPRHLRATTNHNTLFRQGRMIESPPFVGHVRESIRAIIQVFELDAPSNPRVPALPPSWVRSNFTHSAGIEGFDPYVALAGPIFGGPQHKPTVEEAMCMLVRDRSAWDNSLAHQWSISFDVEDAIVQPPYVGTIRVSVYDASASQATEWELDPIDLRLLLLEPHAGLPGAPIPEVFSYTHVQGLLLASRDANGMLTHQSMRKAIDALRRKVVGRLVQLVHLNVIDGGLRLGKLYFQRLRRKLFNSLFPTQWWKDLCSGRSSLQGHMILGGTYMIAGAPASVTVFENQGDLTVRVCWSRARVLADGRRIKRCRVTLHDESIRLMFQESGDLESFVLWKQCVKCNTYPRQVIEEILRNLTLDGAVRRGLCESGNEQRRASLDGECDDRVRTRAQSPSRQGPAYTGKERFVLAGKPLRTRFPFLPLGDARDASYRDPLKLVTNTRALYELIHREVLFISGLHLLVSGRMRTDGDILIEAAKFDQTVLSIRLSKPRVRDLVEKAGLAHLLERQRAKELFATLFGLLAVRTATRPPHTTREHPFFAKFCKMLQVGVPRGAVAHAILHDKDLKASIVDTMHVVLDADHSMQPPDRFRLGPREYECLILSQTRPDEHFRLLYRGVTCVRENVSVSMDVLERNRNLWLRMRRETQHEKDTRVCRTEQAAMALEDDLAKTAREQTTLYLEENAKVMVQTPHMDKIYEERTRLANRIAELRHARRSRLTEALDGMRLDAPARKIWWPSSTVMKRYALRSASPKSWKRATVEAVRRIDGVGCVLRCWQGPSGDALVQVRVPSWSHISNHTIDLDFVSEECWQEAESLRTLALSQAHETMARAKVSRSVASLSQTLLRGCSRKIGPFRIRYDPIEERVFLQTQSGTAFALPIEGPSMPASNTKMMVADESLTDSDEGMLETTAENEHAALTRGSSLKSSSSIDAGIEVFGQSDAHEKTESEVREAARYASQEGQFDVGKDDWKIESELLARYTAAAARTSSGDTIMRELLDPAARVGLGPVTGGATPESDPDAEILAKHSVTLPADMLDILACTKRSDVPFLAHAEAESAPEMQRLISWLASRTRFVLRGAENGKDDAVSFDREFLRHGRLLRCVGQSSQRLGSILRATLSDQGDLLTVANFDRVRGEWTPQVSLELKRGQPVTRGSAIHAFVNLIPQHEGIEAIASEAQDSLLEPRRIQELLRKLLGRCRALNNGNVLLDLNAFQLRIYEAMRARDRAAACLVEDERRARAFLEEACRELCSSERKRHKADLSERADQFARLQDICVAAREWPAMLQEDADAHAIRAYLACESWRLTPIERAFRRFDSNRDGGLDSNEFRALAFSIGHVLTAEEAIEALSLIDKDRNGTISLRELSLWALCAAPSKEKDLKFRRLQFELRVAASRARVRSVAERARTTVAGITALSGPREPGVARFMVSYKNKD